ncbi:MAG TPA: CocE/NonD family hydrolase [Methylomirabilota bacterium]|nr:CocE/NonD family hydrolase [Methylomirabilota bacterium]
MAARIVTDLPYRVRVIEAAWITLADGTRLAARLWLPGDAEQRSVPALLEYLPYRQRDSMRQRDTPMHHYLAGHGYACARVDIRGTGDSDGLIDDEYCPQEQDDALEVIAWLASQPWCDGKVGMVGLSWGGFNSLQVAARRPPALKAIISIGSTDDRYATDVHYMGGCMTKDNVDWAAVMFSHVSTPPDPAVVGERWRDMWMARLEHLQPWLIPWITHQRRDAYWKHGSVCEDFGRIEIPVYAVSGWADNYAAAVPRLLAGLGGPRKGLIGPWAHNFPQNGRPGPAIGWLQEALRWWDHWLKGRNTGIMDEPMLRVWVQDSVRPAAEYAERPGRWVAETSWPSPRIAPRRYALNPGRLAARPGRETPLVLASPQTVGLTAGEIGRYGRGAEHATDQREEDGGSLVFLTEPLRQRIEILGAPVVTLELTSDRPAALVCIRLNDVAPDGSSTRATYGLLNLTHRDSHEHASPLVPGERYSVRVPLEAVAYAFPPGHRIALSISSTYWPVAWPSPEPVTLTVFAGASRLELPVRPPRRGDAKLRPFDEPEAAAGSPSVEIDSGRAPNRTITRDFLTRTTTVQMPRDGGTTHLTDIDLVMHEKGDVFYAITDGEPASACAWTAFDMGRQRGEWRIRTETRTRLTCTATEFRLQAALEAWDGDERVFTRDWDLSFPRDGL